MMKNLLCKIKGHSLEPISAFSYQFEEYKCSKCNKKYTTDGYGKMVRLNKYWEQNNKFFKEYFQQVS